MAIAAGAVWEIRPGGSDVNGGLFLASQPGAGSDYSQQDAAQLSFSDVVTNGSTTVTSATGGFTAAMVGNGINIAGVCYVIATRSSTNSITVDRTIGAASGQTANVGGALGSPGYCAGQAVTGNQIWIKAGTYTLTSSSANVSGGLVSSPGGSAGSPCRWEGYGSARGDKGTKPVIADGAIDNQNLVSTSASYAIFDNIHVTTANSANSCFVLQSASSRAIRCSADGPSNSFYGPTDDIEFLFCEGASTANAPFDLRGTALCCGCTAHGSSGAGFRVGGGQPVLIDCIAFGNGGAGFSGGSANVVAFNGCTAYANTGDGFALSASGAAAGLCAINCLSVGNGGYGFNAPAVSAYVDLIHCATYNNTSGGIRANLTLTEGPIALSADPFAAAPTDLGLNRTAGGGAACRGAGLPSAFPGLASTSASPDIGGAQHADSAAGAGAGRLSLSL